MSEVNLPEGWCQTKLAEIAEWGSGGTPSRKEASYYEGDIPWVKTGDLGPRVLHNSNEFISEIAVKNSSAKYFPKGSVAIAMYGATIGKTSILGIDATTNQACGVGNPIEGLTFSEFLYYFLRNEKKNFIAKGKGGAQPNISQTLIKEHGIALPPLAEQKVIADKLDTLLEQVETTKARLDRIPQILKTFRQSVLAAAVSGKLTEEWRGDKRFNVSNELKQIHKSRDELYQKDNKKHFDKTGKNLRKYDYSTLNEEPVVRAIPEGWELVKLGEIVSFLTDYHANGSYEVLKEHVELKETEDYACMIRATNFEKNNFYDLFVYISEEAYEFLEKSKLYGNEILIGKIGNAGSVYLMPKLDKPASLAMNLFALRFDEKLVNPSYIYMFLNSSLGESNIQKYVKGVATKSIDKKSVRSVFINYPSFEEQSEIVHRVEELFAFAERIEEKGNAALERVNNLTQSILAKAFRGELTADWRAANPELISGENSAEALLEKIKAEREALSSNKKPKKKAVKKAK